MLREMLDEQWKFRTEQIAEITRQEPSGPRRRQTLADHEVLDTVLFGARQALREINSARQRMTDGSYGYCTSCGKMLRIERLEIVPQTALCLSCQRDASSA
jgi:RNA polymerase-binding transcription factor DksA